MPSIWDLCSCDVTLQRLRIAAVAKRERYLAERGSKSATVREAQSVIDALDVVRRVVDALPSPCAQHPKAGHEWVCGECVAEYAEPNFDDWASHIADSYVSDDGHLLQSRESLEWAIVEALQKARRFPAAREAGSAES